MIVWLWKLCKMVFENDVVTQDSRFAVSVPLYKGKGARTIEELVL